MSQPWERQDDETPKAFAAFCVYRDMGKGRSVEKAYRQTVGKESAVVPGYFAGWSSRHDWISRAAAYDEHLASLRVSTVEDGIREDRLSYRETVKREAALFAETAMELRQKASAKIREGGDPNEMALASLTLQRANVVWEKARQVEGMALGLVGEG